MKCPVCGAAELIHDTRDLPYTYMGETIIIPSVTGDFCPACDESITDMAETGRVMRSMLVIKRAVEVFEDERAAMNWLNTPNKALGGSSPLSLSATESGSQAVMSTLGRIKHGVFSPLAANGNADLKKLIDEGRE
jgi:putative toxin-antitoxin system antitoxin component (TIGR02293 family)